MSFRKFTYIMIAMLAGAILSYGCATVPADKKSQQALKPSTTVIPGGTVAPTLGLGFDAIYDPGLDNVIPGYKLLTIAYKNNTMDLIQMNVADDKWVLEDRNGKKIKAITSLRNEDPDTYSKLPKKIKLLIEYPLMIEIGATQAIDLLFKKNHNLGEFRSVTYLPAGSINSFKIVPREER